MIVVELIYVTVYDWFSLVVIVRSAGVDGFVRIRSGLRFVGGLPFRCIFFSTVGQEEGFYGDGIGEGQDIWYYFMSVWTCRGILIENFVRPQTNPDWSLDTIDVNHGRSRGSLHDDDVMQPLFSLPEPNVWNNWGNVSVKILAWRTWLSCCLRNHIHATSWLMSSNWQILPATDSATQFNWMGVRSIWFSLRQNKPYVKYSESEASSRILRRDKWLLWKWWHWLKYPTTLKFLRDNGHFGEVNGKIHEARPFVGVEENDGMVFLVVDVKRRELLRLHRGMTFTRIFPWLDSFADMAECLSRKEKWAISDICFTWGWRTSG